MKLSNLSILLATTTAAAVTQQHEDYDIPATSRLGQSLLQNARSLGNNNNNNGQGTSSWQAGYSIKFHSCATGDFFGGNNANNDQDNNNNKNDNDAAQEANDGFVYKQRLAHFQLCPTNTCGSSKRGCNDYVTDLSDFLAMYVKNKMEVEEMACENVREGCECEDSNDDGLCYSECYAQAGLTTCEQQQQDGGNNNNNNEDNGQYINLQEAVYCTQLEVSDEALEYYRYNNNNNSNQDQNNQEQEEEEEDLTFFVGPHCHQGKVILGLFTEETCSIKAARGSYETMFYGQQLPHSSTSIIESKCMSCKVPNENDANNMNNNNNNNQDQKQNQNKNGNGDMYYYKDGQMYQQQQQQQQQQVYEYEQEVEQVQPDEVTEACSSLYAQSAKCEESLHINGVYPDTRACTYIRSLKKDGFGFGALMRSNVNVTPSILAGLFAATTVVFAGLSVYLHRMVKRSNANVKLIDSDDHDGNVVVKSDSGRLRGMVSRFQLRGARDQVR